MYRNSYQNRRPTRPANRAFSRGGRGKSRLDPSLFIRRASAQVEEAAYVPSFLFTDLPVHPILKANILRKGYISPTPIQDQTIPHIVDGRDVIGIANTGTGKTAAFLIPLIHKLASNPRMKVLILTPTRELATQIQDEFFAFARDMRMWSALCVGGLPIGRQIAALRRNPQFLIATPGRLKDLKLRKAVNLAEFTHLVLDEADRMVDMGFINDIKMLLSFLPKERQSLFFTATMAADVKSLIHSFLKDPVSISVKTQDTAANVDQDVVRIGFGENKMEVLVSLLRQGNTFSKVLIFSRTKRGVDKIAIALEEKSFTVVSIHGDKIQSKRQKALDIFKSNRAQIMVATDVAARGLDIPNVSHVINFDAPESFEDYIHRIGRTGRADKKGKALTFVE